MKPGRSPITGHGIEMAPSDRIGGYAVEARAVFDLVGVNVVFASDQTCLGHLLDVEEVPPLRARLDAHFRCEWSLAEPLIEILERARLAKVRPVH